MPKLTIEHLSKQYHTAGKGLFGKNKKVPVGREWALQDVNLTLEPGVYGLLGANGAGKTTLMNLLTDAMPATKGRVLWDGVPICRLDAKYRAILGYMPQQQNLYDGFTGRRFLYYMAALKGLPAKTADEELARTAALVNLIDELDKRLGAYSGGMKQRLLAASALMGHPQLLILDEPTAGLDPKERVHLRRVLKEASQEAIVLVATHVVSDVETIADQIILVKEGQIIDRGTPAQLEAAYHTQNGLEGVYLTVFGEEDT